MKLQINYKHLSAEFVIVVVGVAVALAADSWREEMLERRIESQYLLALRSDLETGREQVEQFFLSTSELFDATGVLISVLENTTKLEDEAFVIDNFIRASRTGFSPSGLQHDATYQELLSTGRFSLIQDQRVRSTLSEYYRQIVRLINTLDNQPDFTLARFRSLTATVPYGPIQSWQDLDSGSRKRILYDLEKNPDYLEQLRNLRARTGLMVERFRFDTVLELNDELLSLLN